MGSGPDTQMRQIACQELLTRDVACSGWLRGKTILHKLGEAVDEIGRLGIAKQLTSKILWQRRYVVVVDGNLHIYKNETSRRPAKVIDLCEFQKVERDKNLKIKDVPWPFKVSSEINKKVMNYGAMSEPELQKWIEAMKKGIDEAKRLTMKSKKPLPTVPCLFLDDSDDDDPEDLYDYIHDLEEERKPIAIVKPTVPSKKYTPIEPGTAEPDDPLRTKSLDKKSKTTNQQLPKEPDPVNNGSEYEKPLEGDLVREATWTGPVEEGAEIMKSATEDGIFMIRESTEGNGQQTLQVKSDDAVRKYRITKEGDKLRMAGGSTFNSMVELLSFYKKNSIPNHFTKLTKPYSKI